MMITNGILPINKPEGWTSFDVVNKIKHLTKLKVGHLGTLDPMATGVLLITIGKATKLFDLMQEKKKTYLAKFQFGFETDTLDRTGNSQETTSHIPSKNEICAVLPQFIGEIEQIPPKYSAKSVNGKRAYALARQNVEFSLLAKKVEIFNIELVDFQNEILTVKIECGSGTYIRALGRDIARKLGSLATMIDLIRLSVGSFNLENCHEISEISVDSLENLVVGVEDVLGYKTLNLSEDNCLKLLNGQRVPISKPNGFYILKQSSKSVAIIKIESGLAKMSIFLG